MNGLINAVRGFAMADQLDLSMGFLVRHRRLILHLVPDEEGGGYVVTSPFVPGLVTQGKLFEGIHRDGA